MTWDEMKQIDIRTVEKETLVDLKTVEIEQTIEREKVISEMEEKLGNLYVYKVDDIAVMSVYREDGPTLQDVFAALIQNTLPLPNAK